MVDEPQKLQEILSFFWFCPYHEEIISDLISITRLLNDLPTQNVHYTFFYLEKTLVDKNTGSTAGYNLSQRTLT